MLAPPVGSASEPPLVACCGHEMEPVMCMEGAGEEVRCKMIHSTYQHMHAGFICGCNLCCT